LYSRWYALTNITVLGLCLLTVVAVWGARVSDRDLTVCGARVPAMCLLSRLSGRPCPGCGLTRSVVLALHGQWTASCARHSSGVWVMLYFGAQIAARVSLLVRPTASLRARWWDLWCSLGGLALAVTMPMLVAP
jgi:hypothetical protein